MKMIRFAIVLGMLFALILVPVAQAQDDDGEQNKRDPAEEQEIYNRLAAVEPDAVPIFQLATEDMDARNLAAAQEGYLQVLEMAPNFPDALRRLSYVEAQLGNVGQAIEYARAALDVDDSPVNKAALASALLAVDTPAGQQEALRLVSEAASAMPDDEYAAYYLAIAGLMNDDIDALRQGAETLLRVIPEMPDAHFFAGIVAANDNKWIEAEREMLLAKEMGMAPEVVDQALNEGGISRQARTTRWMIGGGIASAGWLVGLGLLFLIGVALSGLTLSAIRRLRPGETLSISPAEGLTRALYRIVIAITSFYFYLSIPFLILAVIALTGGIFYLFLAIGRIPVQLAVALGIGAIYTLIAIVRSLFTRIKQTDPGPRLPREEAPQLWALLEETAERVGTRPVDTVFVTPFPEIGVSERGSLFKKLTGAGERVLTLGLGALPGMTQGQFRAVLAHEYGHFSNRDTAGGNLSLQVGASIRHMAYNLAINRQAHYFNPAWLFLVGFDRIFRRITLGASRLQEVLADRYAALTYGARNLMDALSHIVRQSLSFQLQASSEMEAAFHQQRSPQNLYTLPPVEDEASLKALNEKFREEMYRSTTPYDSHPSIKDRFDLLQGMETSAPSMRDTQAVWDLIPHAQRLQSEMSQALFEVATAGTSPS